MKRLRSWQPWLAALLARLWGGTWRKERYFAGDLDPLRAARSQRHVYSMWHRSLFINAVLYRDCGAAVAISEHMDGEFAARATALLGFRPVRGSSTRGATRLIRELLQFARREQGDLALTPDGPKGPALVSKPGVVYLAGRLGWRLVPTAVAARPCKVFRSWDGFLLPLPFARVVSVGGEPMDVPSHPSDLELEELCRELDRRMAVAADHATARLLRGEETP